MAPKAPDARNGAVLAPKIEDLLRDTLIRVAKNHLKWDIAAAVAAQPEKSIVDLFTSEIGGDFTRYRLAKAFLRWTRDHSASDLSDDERNQWKKLIEKINATLK